MNKATKISIAVFVLALTILLALPFVIKESALRFQIEQKISQKLGVNFEVKGKISVRFLPIPQISLNDAVANNLVISDEYYSNISIASLVIRPEIFSLFGGKIKIDSVIFQNPEIENRHVAAATVVDSSAKTEATKENEKNLQSDKINGGFFNKILNFEDSNKEIFDFKNINSIRFKDGSFSKKNSNSEIALEFAKINFVLKNQLKKQVFTIQGDFFSGDIPTNFNLIANIKNNDDSILTIQSPIINFVAKGKFVNSNINDLIRSNFSGKIDAEIIDLKALLNKYFSKNNLLCLKINATQPIKLSASISDNNGEIKAENIIITSQIIDGSGRINADFSAQKPKIETSFNFNNIDIDNIWFSGVLNNNSKVIDFENETIRKFLDNSNTTMPPEAANQLENKTKIIDPQTNQSGQSVLNNFDLSAEIRVKTAKYYGHNLQDISLSFITDNNGKILLQPFSATIPGGSFKANGALEYENNIPKFTGKVEIIGQDLSKSLSWLKIDITDLKPAILSQYNFTAGLLALPDFAIFNNLNLTVNNGKNIMVGDFKIDDSGTVSTSSANLRIGYLNYDDYFTAGTQSPYLSSGSLLKKLLWLGTINSNRNIYLLFDQLVYQGNVLTNQALRIQFGQGYFKLSDLNIQSPTLDLKGSIDVDIANNNPKFNLDLTSNNFEYKAAGGIEDQFFNLPSLDEFSGKINLNIANLKLNNWQGNEVKIAGKLKNGIAEFDNFNFKAYKGTAKYKGSVVFKNTKTINGSLELLGIDNSQFLSSVFDIKNISGVANLSATINSNGENKAEFAKNLNAKAQFVSANITVKGFGLYDLAAKMVQPKKYQEELSQPLKILYNTNAQSSFKDASGAAEFKRGSTKNPFNIKVGIAGINGVVSGTIDDKQSFNGNGNFIFISGSREKPIPLNFIVNFTGKSGQIQQSTNLGQIEQYLGLDSRQSTVDSGQKVMENTQPLPENRQPNIDSTQ